MAAFEFVSDVEVVVEYYYLLEKLDLNCLERRLLSDLDLLDYF